MLFTERGQFSSLSRTGVVWLPSRLGPLPPPKARGWIKETEDDDEAQRALKLVQNAQRREARVLEATKRGERQVVKKKPGVFKTKNERYYVGTGIHITVCM